jgi:hypothetical protein
MKASRIVIAVLVLLGIGGMAYMLKNREKTYGSEAQKEAQAQVSEIQECKKRLAMIHKAWADHRKSHKGGEPAIPDLVKYMKDPKLYICPTAVRWAKLNKFMNAGSFEANRVKYAPTYGFLWAAPQAPVMFRKLGEKAVLATCTAHTEGLYRAGYKRALKVEDFADENKSKLISEVASAKDLVVLRNGTVEERPPGSY